MGIHHLVRAGVGAGVCGALVTSLALTGAGAGSATVSTPGASGVPEPRQTAGPAPERVDGGARARKICRACSIGVTNVKVSRKRRMVSADVKWARSLIARKGKGHRHRFNVRLVALYGARDKRTGVLAQVSKKHVSSVKEHVRMRLSKRETRLLRTADDAVLSVSHNYDRPRDGNLRYEKNYVTTTHLTQKHFRLRNTPKRTTAAESSAIPAGGNRATSRSGLKNCSNIVIGFKVDLHDCDLTGAHLAYADLYMANLTGADLYMATLTGANLAYADLTDADLRGATLTGANLVNANLAGANMFGAKVVGIQDMGWATCDGTTMPNGYKTPAELMYCPAT